MGKPNGTEDAGDGLRPTMMMGAVRLVVFGFRPSTPGRRVAVEERTQTENCVLVFDQFISSWTKNEYPYIDIESSSLELGSQQQQWQHMNGRKCQLVSADRHTAGHYVATYGRIIKGSTLLKSLIN